ncbi:CinA family protein [Aliidiomarina halalkaliphila]|uniref:CinA family protein n=2 Tax=Aliidiomarina halalkaliphila TaxID=2593535 RepID=A0A552X649_9GAMM|nr:CinA family protein [Aliidiomarina halalkaliphila]
MATAESCTGGGMAYHCTQLAGSSAWFEGGVVCYSNAIKERVLGVPAQVLCDHGAVSTDCARALVEGVQQLCNSDVSVSITGIAGPGGGSADKPVGMVCFGFQVKQNTWTDIQYFTGGRTDVRHQSIQHGLQELINYLLTIK